MKQEEFYYLSSDNKTNIHTVMWLPEGNIKGVVQIVHGITENIFRYEQLAKVLTSNGIAVVGNDLIGHGLSINDKKMYFGPVGSWNFIVNDVIKLKKIIEEKLNIKDIILLGFSLGSFVVRTISIDYQNEYSKLVLIGTGYLSNIEFKLANFMTNKEIKKYGDDKCTAAIKKLAFDTYNKNFKPNKTEFDWLCSNEESLKKYIEDDLSYKKITGGLFRELLFGMNYTCNAKNIEKMNKNIRILMLSGDKDAVGKNGKGVNKLFNLYKKKGIENIELKLYNKCRHDLLHEFNYDIIQQKILEWINKSI